MNPFISIIIPTFNSAKTINACLDIIFGQTFEDYEVLIMDGASTDNTLEIAKTYDDPRIRIYSEPDKGIYDAMNKGIEKSKGEWLYFLGSDDLLFNKNIFQELLNELKGSKYKIVYGDVLIDGEAIWEKHNQIYDGEFSWDKLINQNICHQAIFYHKDVFKKKGVFNIKYLVCADWDMNLRLQSSYKFKYIDKIIAKFKGGATSSTNQNNFDSKEKWDNILKYYKWKIFSPRFSIFFKYFLEYSSDAFYDGMVIKSIFIRSLYYYHRIINRLLKRGNL